MLEIQKIRQDAQTFIKGLENRNIKDAAEKIDQLLGLDQNRRAAVTKLEQLRSTMNQSSRSIGGLMKEGKREEAEVVKSQLSEIKKNIKSLEQEVETLESSTLDLLTVLPNIPHESVPKGKNADDNIILSQSGEEVGFDFEPKPHWELALDHDIINWELGVKLTGAGFPVYKGKGAIFQRALINFFLNQARVAGYTEIMPPLMINAASGFGTGQLPDKEGQMYEIERDGFYLIPTAEVPITNLYRDVILKNEELPVKNCGYTPCFRREAGSYGKDVKGLNRLHQFDKVELVQVTLPENSYETLEQMTSYVESLC